MGKKILDIRYYACDAANIDGSALPGDCQDFFNFPAQLNLWGPRIARRLSNLGVSIGSFDHVYINYSNALPSNKIELSTRTTESWFRYIDYGVSHDYINQLDEDSVEKFVIDSTFNALAEICDKDDASLLRQVKQEIADKGTEINIEVTNKVTASYSVTVLLQIHPLERLSCGLVHYHNLKTGESLNKKFIDLYNYSDIYPLVGAITIKRGSIVIKPKKSFRADLYTNKYTTPLIIDIEEAK